MRRAFLLAAAAACLLQPWAQELEHEWYKYYEDAKAALQSGRCEDALTFLLYSTKKKDRPGRRVQKYSGFYTEYYPYYLMAEAYFCLKKYETAEESLKKEEFYREIQKDSAAYAELQKLRSRIKAAQDAARQPISSSAPQKENLQRLLARGEEFFGRGEYVSARAVFQQVEKDGATIDQGLVQQAADFLAAIDEREEKAWMSSQAAFRAGELSQAIVELDRVMEFKGRHASEAERLRRETQDRLSGEQSFNERLADAEQFLKSGNFEAALQAADRLAQSAGTRPEVKRFRGRVGRQLLDEASRKVQQDRLAEADALAKVAEKYLPEDPETAALRQRLTHWQQLVEAERLLQNKQWFSAEKLFAILRAVPELADRVKSGEARISQARERLNTNRQNAEQLIKAGQLGPAVQTLEVLRRDYPEDDTIGARIRDLREMMRKSGSMEVEEYLRSALDRFFETGDYAQVVFYLDEYLKRKGSRRDLALFFRAVARITLHRLEGGGTGYLDQARQDVDGLSSDFHPPRKWISPGVLTIYDQWRQ